MRILLVVDMQEFTVGDNHASMFTYEPELLNRVNDRIAEFDSSNVIYIRNIMKKNLLNKLAPFKVYEGTPEAELANGLNVVSQHIFTKYKGDAFSNPKLVEYINNVSPEKIEIIGVDGGGCVAYTAIGAASKGLKVVVNEKCVGTIMIKQKKRLQKKMQKMGVKVQD